MALTCCPECGRHVSDAATACPGCGFPITAELRRAFAREQTQSFFGLPGRMPTRLKATLFGLVLVLAGLIVLLILMRMLMGP
jgi:uncharacterized membrane protein YvbJ